MLFNHGTWRPDLGRGDASEAGTMWQIESRREVTASAATVWRLYADPSTWHRWAHNTAWARADGPLAVGARIRVKPLSGPRQWARVAVFEPERRLVSEISLPLARMQFSYQVQPGPSGAAVVHGIRMTGPLSALYGLFIRERNRRQLQEETERLRALAAGGVDPGRPEPA